MAGRRPTDAGILTVQMEMFVNHYFGEAKFNSEEAARLAGYKNPKKISHDLMTRPAIVEEIERRCMQVSQSVQVTKDELVKLLYEEATNHAQDDSSPAARVNAAMGLAKILGHLDRDRGSGQKVINIQINTGGGNVSIGGSDKQNTQEVIDLYPEEIDDDV